MGRRGALRIPKGQGKLRMSALRGSFHHGQGPPRGNRPGPPRGHGNSGYPGRTSWDTGETMTMRSIRLAYPIRLEAEDCLVAALGGRGPPRHSAAIAGKGMPARRADRRKNRSLSCDARAWARQRRADQVPGDPGGGGAAPARPRPPVAYRPYRGGASRPRTAAGSGDTGCVEAPLGANPRPPTSQRGLTPSAP